jgi:peptidoglycan/xylan/chitin deacetylase (PgdA/CDA1 family)
VVLAGRGTRRRAAALLGAGLAACFVAAAPAVHATTAPRPCSTGLIALTFDDGPSPTQTPRLVRILRERGLPATFFEIGYRVHAAPALSRMVQRNGFQIANHTWDHKDLTTLSDQGVHDELAMTGREFRRDGIARIPLMRPPYGAIDARVRRDIAALGLTPVLWTVDSRDWAGGDAAQIADRIMAQLRPHQPNVVLQHDGVANSPNSVDAVPLVVDRARRLGYCFGSLDAHGDVAPPVPHLRVAVIDGAEDGPVPIRVLLVLDRPTTRTVGFRLRTVAMTATAGVDYVPVTERIGFTPGQTRRWVTIRVLPDTTPEQTESLAVVVDEGTRVTIERSTYVARITDDDGPLATLSSSGPLPGPPVPPSTLRVLGPPLVTVGPLDPWVTP